MIAITGNTYPVKDQLKALGGRWNADAKAWMVPDDKADEARRLVEVAPQKSNTVSRRSYSGRRSRGWSGQCSCRQCSRGSESLCERDWGSN